MADETENHTLRLLQEMRSDMQDMRTDMKDMRSDMNTRFDGIDARLDALETNSMGLSTMMSTVVGHLTDINQRLKTVENA